MHCFGINCEIEHATFAEAQRCTFGHGAALGAGLAGQEKVLVSAKSARIAFLEKKREATKADLLLKFEDGDYHGVQDCASDLRDIDSELKGLRL